MIDLKVVGASELRRVARNIKEVGDKDLKRELHRGLNRAVKPLKLAVKAEALHRMPSGYAPVLTGSLKVGSSIRAAGAIKIRASAKGKRDNRDLRALDERGSLKHPLYGNRNRWYTTRIRPGFFTDPLVKGAHQVRAEVVQVINRVARKMQGG